jgi:hypothetical protein
MIDLGFFMKTDPNPVSAIFIDNTESVRPDITADHIPNVPEPVSGADLFDSQIKAMPGNLNQALCFRSDMPDHVHPGTIAEKSIQDGCDINVDNVTFFEKNIIRRNPMANNFIGRDAA